MLIKPKLALLINSITLIAFGIIGYLIKSSPTALIPAIFGFLLVLSYLIYDRNNKLVAHVALVLIFLIICSLFTPLISRLSDNDIGGILRIIIMQIVSCYTMVCFIVSFINARKQK